MMLAASNFLVWVVVLLLIVAVAALARQIGLLHERIATLAAPTGGDGPHPGEPAPVVTAKTIDGRVLTIGCANDAGQAVLLLFVAPECPICKRIIPLAMVTARAEALKLIFVGDGADGDCQALRRRLRMTDYDFVDSVELGHAYRIGKPPAAALIRPDGSLAAKGPVATHAHLEKLAGAPHAGLETGPRPQPPAEEPAQMVAGVPNEDR